MLSDFFYYKKCEVCFVHRATHIVSESLKLTEEECKRLRLNIDMSSQVHMCDYCGSDEDRWRPLMDTKHAYMKAMVTYPEMTSQDATALREFLQKCLESQPTAEQVLVEMGWIPSKLDLPGDDQ